MHVTIVAPNTPVLYTYTGRKVYTIVGQDCNHLYTRMHQLLFALPTMDRLRAGHLDHGGELRNLEKFSDIILIENAQGTPVAQLSMTWIRRAYREVAPHIDIQRMQIMILCESYERELLGLMKTYSIHAEGALYSKHGTIEPFTVNYAIRQLDYNRT